MVHEVHLMTIVIVIDVVLVEEVQRTIKTIDKVVTIGEVLLMLK